MSETPATNTATMAFDPKLYNVAQTTCHGQSRLDDTRTFIAGGRGVPERSAAPLILELADACAFAIASAHDREFE